MVSYSLKAILLSLVQICMIQCVTVFKSHTQKVILFFCSDVKQYLDRFKYFATG